MRFVPPLLPAALLAAAALGCDGDEPSPAPDAAPPPLVAALEAELQPVDGLGPALLGVWGAADDAVYFAGGTTAPEGGALYRFDGAGITPELTPPGPLLWWVWGADAEHVWACGEAGRILRRTADGWVAEDTGLDEKAVLWGLWGSGPTDLWAVGGSVRRGGPKGVLLRSGGDGVWRAVEDPALPELNLYKVWGSGPSDVWLVGEGTTTVRFDGANFTRTDLGERDLLFTVHGRPGGPLLAVGGVGSGLIYAHGPDGWMAEDAAGAIGLNGVAVRADGLALASGARGALVLRDLDGHWFRLRPTAADTVGARTLHAVWHAPSGTTWTVGGDLSDARDGIILTDRTPLPELIDP